MDNSNLIWIDCEMTGLSLERDALVEIAVLVTDSELNILGDGIELVISCSDEALTQMSEVVRTMHTESGLLPLIKGGTSLTKAEDEVLEYLARHTAAGKSPLAGNSVWMDRNFIMRDMPRLGEWLHYRTVDVSSIKELARRWYPKTFFNAPKKTGNHRALGDIRDSIDELKYYRGAIFNAS